jgi:hypothetical protein
MHRPMIPGRNVSTAALAAALAVAGSAQFAKIAKKLLRFMPNPVGLSVAQGAAYIPAEVLTAA